VLNGAECVSRQGRFRPAKTASSPRTTCRKFGSALELQEIYGIGERAKQRLHRAGIFTVARL
jgi:predicted flap endonuclease-1-like 5' DNA nuclease